MRWTTGTSAEVNIAYSREANQKVYIQDLMTKNSERLSAYVASNVDRIKIYVCGKAQLFPDQVKERLVQVLKHHNKPGDQIVQQLELNGQWMVDAW